MAVGLPGADGLHAPNPAAEAARQDGASARTRSRRMVEETATEQRTNAGPATGSHAPLLVSS